jgi:signal peptidase I
VGGYKFRKKLGAGIKVNRKTKKRNKSTAREWGEAVFIAVILALFVRTFLVQAFKIPSGSMMPTLLIGDYILVNKFIYGIKIPFTRKTLIPIRRPGREDVIVFIFPEDKSVDFIKRVIGLPGDTIEIKNRNIYINGILYNDRHGFYGTSIGNSKYFYGPKTVPDKHLFVMGDNRNNSRDSRFWGYVPMELVKGKAFIIYWSWPKRLSAPRWNRLLHLVR